MKDVSFIDRIKPYHLDVLREVGNIGAGNAATALSRLLNKLIDMNVPSVRIVSFQEITELIGGADETVAGVYLRIEGDVPGNMFFILTLKEAEELIRKLTGLQELDLINQEMDEMAVSALQELGNILSGSYLSALSDFTKLSLQPSVPQLSVDMFGAILNYGLIELSHVSDYAIVIDTRITEMENDAKQSTGHFFLLPDPESFTKLFKALGVEIDE